MTTSSGRPSPSAHVSRQLRQEAGFGCVKCGCPILEYHHIIEWRMEKHFRPQDMVAVCPTCHRRFATMREDEQRWWKENPINKKRLFTYDEVIFDIDTRVFCIGDNVFMGCNRMIYVNTDPILEWVAEPTGSEISATLHDEDGSISAKIYRNDLVVMTDGLWDFEYKPNFFSIRDRAGSIRWQLDMRREPATFRGVTYLAGVRISIESKRILIGDSGEADLITGNVFPEGGVGISIYDERFARPSHWGHINISIPVIGRKSVAN